MTNLTSPVHFRIAALLLVQCLVADAVAGAADVGSMCECGGCDISI